MTMRVISEDDTTAQAINCQLSIVNCQLPSVATIGFFDGVHLGHKYLVGQVADEAGRRGLRSLVATFPKHPLEVLRPGFRPEMLSTCEEKVRRLREAGADDVALLDFTPELAAMSARDFMEKVLRDRLCVRVLVVGYDHKFGHGGGTFDDYVRYGRELGIEVVLAKELVSEGQRYSSSVVRRALKDGDVTTVTTVLGRHYVIEGKVVAGFGVGRKLGFPTANIELTDTDRLIPRRGVYAVRASFSDGMYDGEFAGMMNIGCRPTLDNGEQRSIEIHLFDFDADIYSLRIKVKLVAYIRDERKFDSLENLQKQLAEDEKVIKTCIPN